jgi:DNA-binding CsgD family transcriptional regulator
MQGQGVAVTLARLLAESPGMPPAEVARRLGISRQLARYHLRRLETDRASP